MENYTQDPKGYFKCPTCGKPFYSIVVLKVHIKREQCLNWQKISQEKSSVTENDFKKDCVAKNVDSRVKSETNEDINLNIIIKRESAQTRQFSTNSNIPVQSKICEDQTADTNPEKQNGKLKSRHCQECNKTFRRKRYLPIHINVVHKNIKIFQCVQCPKAFGINSTLQQHIIAVHEKCTPYQCQKCNKAFSRNSNLQTHINTVHKKCTPSNVKIELRHLD